MKSIKIKWLAVMASALLLIGGSCEKEKVKSEEIIIPNKNPIITLLSPDDSLILEQDTLLSIVMEPIDLDGEIDSVTLFINDIRVHSFDSSPYRYDWNITVIEDIGVYRIQTIVYDDKGATGEAVINIEVRDFRSKYYGDFRFEVVKTVWSIEGPMTYDTSYYDGIIRKFDSIDSVHDLFPDDDSYENPNEKITIEFRVNTLLTTLLDKNGVLVPKIGYHYGHHGYFIHLDSIVFAAEGFGGLGGGHDFYVSGVRLP